MPKGIPKLGTNKGWFKKNTIPWNKDKVLGSNLEHSKRMKGIKWSEEVIRKRANSHIGYKHSDETKIKISRTRKKRIKLGLIKTFEQGDKNPSWKGGKSFEKYPRAFLEIRNEIIDRDNHRCQECFRHREELTRDLCVHHIDFDKKNNNKNNLIALCTSCHAQTNFNRDKWITYFQNQMKIGGKFLCQKL